MPWVYGGYDEVVNIKDVDYIVENYEYKIPEFPAAPLPPRMKLSPLYSPTR